MTRLICADCMDVLGGFVEKSIDMILCDLPYGVTQNRKDVALPLDSLWSHYRRIIKDNGCIALFGQGLFFVDLVNSNRKMFRYDLVWDKVLVSGFLNAKKMPMRQHEQIAVFYKKPPVYNPQFRKGDAPIHSYGTKRYEGGYKNNNYGAYSPVVKREGTDKYPTSILSFQKPHPSVSVHPTEKPVPLLEYLIKTYTNEGDLVLDNCMGSGSTGIACVNTRRNFLGIEMDKYTFELAKSRIEKAEAGQ